MQPPRQDLTMPLGLGVDNCSHTLCRKGRSLDLGGSRSLTQIVQRKLLPTSHLSWAYAYAFGADGHGCDGDDGDDHGDGDGNGNGDGVGDGHHSTRGILTSKLAMSMSASKLQQT